MPLLEWDEGYSVQTAVLDEEHRKLFDITNRLYDAVGEGRGSEAIGPVLKELAAYTDYHFTHEESYFNKHDFREKDIHASEHTSFKRKVTEFNDKFAGNPMVLSIEVMYYLADWIKKHIKQRDGVYARELGDME